MAENNIGQLFARIAKVQAAVGTIEKDAKHGQGYNYHSAESIMHHLSSLMSSAGLITIPRVKDIVPIDEDGTSVRWIIYYVFTLADIDGNMFDAEWTGEEILKVGQRPDDKAMGKAHTYAHKYWLMKLFMVSSVKQDDADENDSSQDEKPAAKVKNEQRQAVESGEPEILTTDATVKIVTKKSKNGQLYRIVQGNCLWNRDAFRQLKYPENIIEAMNKEGEVTLPDPIFIEYIEKPKENGQGKDTTPLRMIRKNKNWVVDIKNTKE